MTPELHQITIGDTLTPLGAELVQENENGQERPVNLTGLTVKFTMVNSAGTTIVDAAAATVKNAKAGLVEYQFKTADFTTPGEFYGWFSVHAGDDRDSFPIGGRNLIIQIAGKV